MRPPAPLAVLASHSSSRGRALVLLAFLTALAGRVAVLGTALAAADGATTRVGLLGVTAALIVAIHRAIQSVARVRLESDFYDAATAAVLRADVLSPPIAETQRIFEGVSYATDLCANVLPTLAADLVLATAILPFVFKTFSRSVLGLAAIALVLVLVAMLLVRGPTLRLEQRAAAAREEVGHHLLGAIEARLELVAAGGEDAYRKRFGTLLADYEHHVRRSALGSALLGRVPLAAGMIAVVAAVLFDSASREALASAVLLQAIVLAACVPPIMSIVLGSHGLVRIVALVTPFARLLGETARADLLREGKPVPALPSPLVAERVSFAYADGAPLVLDDVSFEWTPGEPLVLLGPNGSGKSTLLRLFIGLRPPTSGSLRLGGEELAALDGRSLRKSAVYLPQRPYLGEVYASVRSSFLLTCPDATDEAITRSLERVAILDALRGRAASGSADGVEPLEVPIGQLSSGQRQRVAVARVLVHDARLVLLDEPDTNLDSTGVELIGKLIRDLTNEGRMVAVAAHSPTLAHLSSCRVELGSARQSR